jgi:hypothetical protein
VVDSGSVGGTFRGNPDIEAHLARETVHRVVFLGPLLVVVFALFRGGDGAIGSLIGLALVVGNFLLYGLVLSRAARVSLSFYHAAALFGFFLRLGLITAAMFIVVQLVEIDRIAMGVSAVVAYLGLLTWEAAAISKGREREMEWNH